MFNTSNVGEFHFKIFTKAPKQILVRGKLVCVLDLCNENEKRTNEKEKRAEISYFEENRIVF